MPFWQLAALLRMPGSLAKSRAARSVERPRTEAPACIVEYSRIAEPRLRPGNDGPGPRIEAARGTVWRAIQAVGGIASPAGSCLWHVLGWERPVKEWALEQGWSGRRVSQEAASGILVAALGALESHLGSTHSLRDTHF